MARLKKAGILLTVRLIGASANWLGIWTFRTVESPASGLAPGFSPAESVEQAKAELDTLPLVAAKLMTYDLMPVTTLTPFGLLIQGK
jgi:hypothetical protein